MILDKKQLKAILAFASDDPILENICGIATVDGILYATDGHTAIQWATADGDVASGWIPREVAERAIKIAKVRDEIVWSVDRITVDGIEIGKVDQINHPHHPARNLHTRKIVDWTREPSGCPEPWAINVEYMARLAAVAKAAGVDPHWIVDAPDPDGPILFRLRGEPRIQVVIMPVRID